ncbi:MAG: adenosine kinase [Alloprevotella tannerae]|nr:adenosine kinase [Alloprevotella tannerae]
MKRVLGFGNALVDVLTRVEDDTILEALQLPKGSMQLIDAERYRYISDQLAAMQTTRATGGSACNTILALGRLGMSPGVVGKIGDDDNGRFFEESCRRNGIWSNLLRSEKATGVASTFISPDGQRTFGTYLGAAAEMCAEEIDEALLEAYDYVYIEGYLVQNHDLLRRIVAAAKAKATPICLDLASYNIVADEIAFFTELLPNVDILFANQQEAEAFTGESDPEAALLKLGDICRTVVVKTGGAGARAKRGTEVVNVPARPVQQVLDTTGAGDFFAAGFLYGLSNGCELAECVYKGTVLAAYVIEVAGTHLPEETWDAIRAEMNAVRPAV